MATRPRAVRMMKTGDFHPDFFDYPGLFIYLQTGVAAVRFMAGAMAGLWMVLVLSTTAQLIALALVLLITLYGEFRSISQLIDRTPLLRFVDQLGRR